MDGVEEPFPTTSQTASNAIQNVLRDTKGDEGDIVKVEGGKK